jgi:hypothetical protein
MLVTDFPGEVGENKKSNISFRAHTCAYAHTYRNVSLHFLHYLHWINFNWIFNVLEVKDGLALPIFVFTRHD